MTLAIVDLRMPGLSGAKDIAQIRLVRPDVLVVVLSGSDRREDILDALSAGVHGYIVKIKTLISWPTDFVMSVRRDLCAANLGRTVK